MTVSNSRHRPYEESNSFVGRTSELGELRHSARAVRELTLCGAGGIGKTRLALRLLAQLAGDFPDGAFFVELGDLRQPELVVSRVASVIGVDEEPGRPLIDTLADALRPRKLLLALDNCEHLIDECASLCQRLLASAPALQIIATSREPLRVAAEAVCQVPPLALPPPGLPQSAELAGYDALRLFADRAAAAAPGFTLRPDNAATVAAICRALDGLPLAIELAAAWVRVLSVEQISARLHDRFQLLSSGDRTAPERQQGLRATIDWSHDLLAPMEQVLLRRLSIFAGWSLDMAEEVCSDANLPREQVLDLLTALADKSLIEVEPEVVGQARYRMLETIREYAATRLAEAGETAVVERRMRDYTLREVEHLLLVGMALIRAPWSARQDVFRRFDAESANMRLVLSRCLASGDAETGLRICSAMRPVWIVRGYFAEGAEWFDSFLSLGGSEVPANVRGPALAGRAQLALASDPAGAEALAKAGLELCWAAGEGFWTATVLNLLTEAALHAGRIDDAAANASEAVAIARNAGDRWNEGYALGTQAAVAARQGGLHEAQHLAEAALVIMRDIDQQWGVARTLLGLADLARLTGDLKAARERYLEALGILRDLRARPEIARCLAGLGRIAMEQGDLALARQRLSESMEVSASTGSRIGVIRALDAFTALAVSEDRPEHAVQLAAAAAACRELANLAPAPPARTQRILDTAAAAGLAGQDARRLWAAGSQLSSAAAGALALQEPDRPAAGAAGQWPAAEAASAPPAGLTPREREIVALIARGASNKAIAAELYISPATAARHVANVLAKLGFSSRSQIAAWAAEGRDTA